MGDFDPPSPQAPPAGWYSDPEQPGMQRWWDGTKWTDQRTPTPPANPQPLPPPLGAIGAVSPGMMSPGMTGPPPDNQMVPAILTTLFCCLPFGIVSIVKAASVNSLWATGQVDAARAAADAAKKWWQVSMFVGITGAVLYFLFIAAASSSSGF